MKPWSLLLLQSWCRHSFKPREHTRKQQVRCGVLLVAGRREVCGESWGNRRESRSPSVGNQSWALGHLVETAKYVEPDVEHRKCLALLTFWFLGRHCSMACACIYLHREKRRAEPLMGTRSYGAFLTWDMESHLWRGRRAMWRFLLEKWDYPSRMSVAPNPWGGWRAQLRSTDAVYQQEQVQRQHVLEKATYWFPGCSPLK